MMCRARRNLGSRETQCLTAELYNWTIEDKTIYKTLVILFYVPEAGQLASISEMFSIVQC